MKTQIWLNENQLELVVECLKFTKIKVSEEKYNDVAKMTGRYFCRRIDEILYMLDKKSFSLEP